MSVVKMRKICDYLATGKCSEVPDHSRINHAEGKSNGKERKITSIDDLRDSSKSQPVKNLTSDCEKKPPPRDLIPEELSNYLSVILKPIAENSRYAIQTPYQLKCALSDVNINENYQFIIIEAKQTMNYWHQLVLVAIENRWHEIRKLNPDLDHSIFRRILLAALNVKAVKNKNLTDLETWYPYRPSLTDSPSTGYMADIVLDHVLSIITPKYDKYVALLKRQEDRCIILMDKFRIEQMLYELNIYTDTIKFSLTTEMNKQISFLNLKLYRRDYKVLTEYICDKDLDAKIINFFSVHAYREKCKAAENFINQILFLTDPPFQKKQLKYIRSILSINNYPTALVNQKIRAFYNDKYVNNRKCKSDNKVSKGLVRKKGANSIKTLIPKDKNVNLLKKVSQTKSQKETTTEIKKLVNTRLEGLRNKYKKNKDDKPGFKRDGQGLTHEEFLKRLNNLLDKNNNEKEIKRKIAAMRLINKAKANG